MSAIKSVFRLLLCKYLRIGHDPDYSKRTFEALVDFGRRKLIVAPCRRCGREVTTL